MKNRIAWVDALKGLGIVLVVIGHTDCPDELLKWIYIFHMPLFFMLSGLMSKDSENIGGGQWIRHKSRGLLWPYFFFGVCEFLFDSLALILKHTIRGDYLIKKVIAITYSNFLFEDNYTGVIWFLTCLFMTELIFFILLKAFSTNYKRVIVVIALSMLGYYVVPQIKFLPPFFMDIALNALPFYSLGYYMRVVFFSERKAKIYKIGLPIFIIGSVLGMINQRELGLNHVDMLYRKWGDPLLFIISAMLCLVGLVLAFMNFQKILEKRYFKLLNYIGRNSLIIFSIHLMVMQVLAHYIRSLGIVHATWVLLTIATLTVSICFTAVINKYFHKIIYLK